MNSTKLAARLPLILIAASLGLMLLSFYVFYIDYTVRRHGSALFLLWEFTRDEVQLLDTLFSSVFTVGAGSILLAAMTSILTARTSEVVEARKKHLEDLRKLGRQLLCVSEILGTPLTHTADEACLSSPTGEWMWKLCNVVRNVKRDARLSLLYEDLNNHFYRRFVFKRRGLADIIDELCELEEELVQEFKEIVGRVDRGFMSLGIVFSMVDLVGGSLEHMRMELVKVIHDAIKHRGDREKLEQHADELADALLGSPRLMRGLVKARRLVKDAFHLLQKVLNTYVLPGGCELVG